MVADSVSALSPFSRDKLFIDIYESCKHRPNALRDAASLVDTVVSRIIAANTKGTIHTHEIIKITLLTLKRFDRTAAVIYEAYHTE